MIHLWWPAFVVPVLMILGGLLPGLHYRSPGGALDEERQRFADGQLHRMLWQFGLAFAALSFMVMQSVRLLPMGLQQWLLYGAVVLEVLGVLLMVLPIERMLKAQFDEESDENEGDRP